MFIRNATAILAICLIAATPLAPAFARGGGGGGGGGGGNLDGGGGGASHGGDNGGRGNTSYSRSQNDNRANLYDQARRACNGNAYPSGAIPSVNYDAGTFSCMETGSSRH